MDIPVYRIRGKSGKVRTYNGWLGSGIKDKNDNEIFHGDCISIDVNGKTYYGFILFNLICGFDFLGQRENGENFEFFSPLICLEDFRETMEIIFHISDEMDDDTKIPVHSIKRKSGKITAYNGWLGSGMKDKNGNEIFEDDCISFINENGETVYGSVYIVKGHSDGFFFMGQSEDGDGEFFPGVDIGDFKKSIMKVIFHVSSL